MNTHHADKYRFVDPRSMEDAEDRRQELLRDIWSIEKQLSDGKRRLDRDGKPLSVEAYKDWHSRTRASLVYKNNEYRMLKRWIKDRRASIEAGELGVRDANSPRDLLIGARGALRKALDGGAANADVGRMFKVIDQYLKRAA